MIQQIGRANETPVGAATEKRDRVDYGWWFGRPTNQQTGHVICKSHFFPVRPIYLQNVRMHKVPNTNWDDYLHT